MNGKTPNSVVVHPDGRKCVYRAYWVGNPRDGHWEHGYWYKDPNDPENYWRYCDKHGA